MLRLTRRTEYGLMALALLAQKGGPAGGFCCVREIVDQLSVPRRLLAEILKDLSHAGLVCAARGPSGGYRLCRPASQLSLAEVVAVLEGPHLFADCTGGGRCGLEHGCTIRNGIRGVAARIQRLLADVSVQDIAGARPAPAPQRLELELQR
ncbi:MAG: Rrf2 family transcriptional regulator [Planctomycetota bacterium]|nr:MAG: Rrf2 family transcriptional regulator [Planctomycetota bacterium]